jgi:hypothetical protein
MRVPQFENRATAAALLDGRASGRERKNCAGAAAQQDLRGAPSRTPTKTAAGTSALCLQKRVCEALEWRALLQGEPP